MFRICKLPKSITNNRGSFKLPSQFPINNQNLDNNNSNSNSNSNSDSNNSATTTKTEYKFKNKIRNILRNIHNEKDRLIVMERNPWTKYKEKKELSIVLEQENWCQWLGGIIDGSGSFVENKKDNKIHLTIKLESSSYSSLALIKHKLGEGTIQVLSGEYTVVYEHPNVNEYLVNLINGNIRHPVKQEKLQEICNLLGIEYKAPIELTETDGWVAGVFESIGKLEFNTNDLSINLSFADKREYILKEIHKAFGGRLVYDKALQGHYQLHFQKRDELERLMKYFNQKQFKIKKATQLKLVPEFCKLLNEYEKKGNSDGNLPFYIWDSFLKLWEAHKEEYYENDSLKSIEKALDNDFKKDKIKIYNSFNNNDDEDNKINNIYNMENIRFKNDKYYYNLNSNNNNNISNIDNNNNNNNKNNIDFKNLKIKIKNV